MIQNIEILSLQNSLWIVIYNEFFFLQNRCFIYIKIIKWKWQVNIKNICRLNLHEGVMPENIHTNIMFLDV